MSPILTGDVMNDFELDYMRQVRSRWNRRKIEMAREDISDPELEMLLDALVSLSEDQFDQAVYQILRDYQEDYPVISEIVYLTLSKKVN
jgi:hypothetical protein